MKSWSQLASPKCSDSVRGQDASAWNLARSGAPCPKYTQLLHTYRYTNTSLRSHIHNVNYVSIT